MQNRYVGDIGDFGKYALLKALGGDGLRLGVHWYLNPDEEGNSDGKFTDYPHLRSCDPPLFDKLHNLVATGRRSVRAVEQAKILPPDTVFFNSPLSSVDRFDRAGRRTTWNREALRILDPADLVFMDPDNGLVRRPIRDLGPDGVKYVSAEELCPYYRSGKSVIVYHHQTRERGGLDAVLSDKFALLKSVGYECIWALVFRRTSVRTYFIAAAPEHLDLLSKRTLAFSETMWLTDGHFQLRATS